MHAREVFLHPKSVARVNHARAYGGFGVRVAMMRLKLLAANRRPVFLRRERGRHPLVICGCVRDKGYQS